MNAFILAAGYGERLRPVTDHIPKPLLPICGKPAIEVIMGKLVGLPVDSCGINIHHKSEMLMQWADTSPYSDKIELFPEKDMLGTGGALGNAAVFLGKSAFIVHNADILSDINLERLVEEHFASGNIITLAVHDYERFNNLWIARDGSLKHIGKTNPEAKGRLCKIAYTGIAIYSPDFLAFLPEGNSSVVDAWLKVLHAGWKIGTVDFSGCFWTDIGTPDTYAAAVFETLKKEGETLYVHPSVDCGWAEIEGFASLERGCMIGGETYLKNCVLLPDAQVPEGRRIEDALVGPDYIISLEKTGQPLQVHFTRMVIENFFRVPLPPLTALLIGTGGSDRKYYRISSNNKSAVLMVCSADDPDYERHIAYTEFFRRYALPVPELFGADRQRKQALFEDLGDRSLYAWLKCRRDPAQVEGMYRIALDMLTQLHTVVSDAITECPLLEGRIFDYEHLRWETAYFLERFVSGLAGMSVTEERTLLEEFQRLAEIVDAFPKTVVHRDFQSQNIMIAAKGVPRLIDYQGARMGPPAYDLAALLWDPYSLLGDDMRERLLAYYIEAYKASAANGFDEAVFRYALLLCRLQRHMQALGAYGFLSLVRGKHYFRKHIPQALAYLAAETEQVCGEFPALHELVTKLSVQMAKEMTGR